MAIGLRTFLKDLAKTTGRTSFDALYERQRELVRCGIFEATPGRGPGSGVPLTAETLAMFLIGLLATDSLVDLGKRTAILSAATRNPPDTRGHVRFVDDVASALLQKPLPGFLKNTEKTPFIGIQAIRPWRGVILQATDTGERSAEYVVAPDDPLELPLVWHTVSIQGRAFHWISLRLQDYLEDDAR